MVRLQASAHNEALAPPVVGHSFQRQQAEAVTVLSCHDMCEISTSCLRQIAVRKVEGQAGGAWVESLIPPHMSESMSFTGDGKLLEAGGVYWQVGCMGLWYQ